MSSRTEIVRLAPDDWEAHRDLRLEALTTDPEAFGAAEPTGEPSPPPVRGPFGTLPPPRTSASATLMDDAGAIGAVQSLRGELKSIEKQRILDALAKAAGNQSQAAKLLGMSRYTLIARIEEYGLARPRKR